MDNNMNPAEAPAGKEYTEETVKYIATLLRDGKDPSFVVANLVENGYPYDSTYALVTAVHQKMSNNQVVHEKKNASADLIFGLILLVAGIAITVSSAGVIWYGAILVGAIKIIRGLSNL
ncbi:MAG: hypothetical protein NTW29_14275 [Bacteroidetes bacterium]|nr:hypothetical protein [Bacteroidota bacterium]